ncbi:hypothetical protein O181_000858 [Austropuccinia psidii MF-1]|uniref:T-cell immunomodulatory protein TIP C2 domain-containing protein n=1 Tax=Austropuccinia psidii MF-1 TaxID=1389203 RepID=A0A9Q3B9M4_9BASI|nr:hypothetical protein [Austropuccinia psidii MF-1]
MHALRLNAFLASTQLMFLSALMRGSDGKKFKAEGLYNLGTLGLDDLDGMIIALGDSNADQYQDIFTLGSDQHSVNLYLWDRGLDAFAGVANNPVIPRTIAGFSITNVIATDINHDGRLDLLVMGSKEFNGGTSDILLMEVWLGQDGISFSSGIPIPSSLSPHPLVFDSGGLMSPDLLGLPSSLPSAFKIWRNVASSNQSAPFTIADVPFDNQVQCNLPNPHSSAFIDLDGDCLADIFLTCEAPDGQQTYQIWINNKYQGYSLARSDSLPLGTKQISFADIDRDGTIDMAFAACPSKNDCKIHVAYNQQIPLCTNTGRFRSGCRDSQNLCSADPNFHFSFDSSQSSFTSLPIIDIFPGFNLITELSPMDFSGPSPISIQTGDYNLDGYPDLLILVEPQGSATASRGVPQLLESIPCSAHVCTAAQTYDHRRAFKPLTYGVEALTSISDAKGVFFMDIDEDGSLDVVVQRAHKKEGSSRAISFIKNNFYSDAFFLKAIMLNGACSSRCSGKYGQDEYRPYGVNYAGASYKFTIQDAFGQRRATAVGQIPFSTYASPTTPYCFFGLGRTNNYVENMFVGSTRHQRKHFINIEGLLPNSQLVIIPYQAPDSTSPSSWKRELYLHPGDWIPWVTFTLAIATLVLAIIVGVLHINEKREDERERRRKAHTINFDAL